MGISHEASLTYIHTYIHTELTLGLLNDSEPKPRKKATSISMVSLARDLFLLNFPVQKDKEPYAMDHGCMCRDVAGGQTKGKSNKTQL